MSSNNDKYALDIQFELRNITKLYAGTVALNDVSFSISRGEIHGLIGKNGAGKSTLVGIISGIIPPSRGEILVSGHSYSALTPSLAKHHGIAIITQEPQGIDECTIAENLFMPLFNEAKVLIDWKTINREAVKVLRNHDLPFDPTLKFHNLTLSEKQLLLVIKACYVDDAEIIIMDEVSASLSNEDKDILHRIVRDSADRGKTIIYISHQTREVLELCDCVTVLTDGRIEGTHLCKNLNMENLAALIVGKEYITEISQKAPEQNPEIVFETRNYTSPGKFSSIDIQLHKNEILGLAGLRGSGRSEFFLSIIGTDSHIEGEMYIEGKAMRFHSPAQAASAGILYLPEDREQDGIVAGSPLKHNLSMSVLDRISSAGIIHLKEESTRADDLIEKLQVKALSSNQLANQLSGGNKQKLLVGRIMTSTPLICLLDEPTRGVDIEAKESILNTIDQELRQNSSVIITSPGVDDLLKICDRIIVLNEGRIIDEFTPDGYSEENVYRAMQGEVINENSKVRSKR